MILPSAPFQTGLVRTGFVSIDLVSTVLALGILLLATGCASTGPNGTMSEFTARTAGDSVERPVDSVYVAIDFTSQQAEYAKGLAQAFDTVFVRRGMYVETNPSGQLLVSRVPGMQTAQDANFPFLLVLTQRSPSERTYATSIAIYNQAFLKEFETTAGRLDGTVVTAQLYDTDDESALWLGQFVLDGEVPPDRIARTLHEQMRKDGLMLPSE